MTIQYQYQRSAEPVSQDPEAVSIDKWQGSDNQPVRTSVFSAAVFAVSMAFVPVVSAVETVTVDKWFQPASVPVVERPDINRGSFDIDSKVLTLAEDVKIDKWFQDAPMPVVGKRGVIGDSLSFVPVVAAVETVTVDKWFVELSRPVIRRPKLPDAPASSFVAIVSTTLDKWYRELSTPVVKRQDVNRGRLDIDPQLLTQPEDVKVDKWFQPLSEPVRAIERPVNTPSDFLVEFSVPATVIDAIGDLYRSSAKVNYYASEPKTNFYKSEPKTHFYVSKD